MTETADAERVRSAMHVARECVFVQVTDARSACIMLTILRAAEAFVFNEDERETVALIKQDKARLADGGA